MAEATRIVWQAALAGEPPNAVPPQVVVTEERNYLAFDATSEEWMYFSGVAPVGLTGTLKAVLYWLAASATTGAVSWVVWVEAITPGDASDLLNDEFFDDTNSAATTVPGTAGYLTSTSITLTNTGSIAAGDAFRLAIGRDAEGNYNTDDAAGDAYLWMVELRDGG